MAKNSNTYSYNTIKLKDQFDQKMISWKNVSGYHRNNNEHFVLDFVNVNQSALNELNISCSTTYDQDRLAVLLRPNGVIGAIPLRNPLNHRVFSGLVVEPRFGWNDYGPLLKSIGWAAAPKILNLPLVPGSAKEIPPWVIAAPLVFRLGNLLRNINRGFELIHEVRNSPRGRILWNEYVTKSLVIGNYHKLPCEFPDLGSSDLLRSYIRWSLERIKSSLLSVRTHDHFSLYLIEIIEILLTHLKNVPVKLPTKSSLGRILKQNPLSNSSFVEGITSIFWIIDEKGLAGARENDGIAWKLTMHELFESWVETVARQWATKFGGIVTTSREDTSKKPIYWSNSIFQSLSHLSPDVIIETSDTVYIIDAKYKSYFEELDDRRWRELSENIQEEHRHDLHQVIAYSSLFNKKRIVSILAYPLYKKTYDRLSDRGEVLNRAIIPIENKTLEIGIFGLSLSINDTIRVRDLSDQLDPLLYPLGY